MKPLSIRASLTAWFVGLTTLLLLVFSATLYICISRALHSGLDVRLEATAMGLVPLSDCDEFDGAIQFELSGELAKQLDASNPAMSQELWTWPGGERFHQSGEPMDLPLPPVSWNEGIDLSSAPAVSYSTFVGMPGQRRLCTMLALAPADPEEPESQAFNVLVRVAEDLAPIKAQLSKLAWFVLLLGIISAVVILLFGVILSKRVVRPLKVLGKAASEIRAGSTAQLPRRGVGDEVDVLGELLDEAFKRLEGALQRQTRFTSDAAHELRNPIAVIQNAAEVALRRERSTDEYQAFFGDVLATSRRMGQVVEALLLLARLDAGRAGETFKKVDLVAIARDSAAAQHLAKDRVRIHAESPAFVEGDDGLLRVLVDNLLSNALRYSGPESAVLVTVEVKDDVILRVQDEGPGIPSDDVGRVFDRFYRAETGNAGVSGAGLGLALVAEVARVHSVESHIDTSQRGTCITVRFPPI